VLRLTGTEVIAAGVRHLLASPCAARLSVLGVDERETASRQLVPSPALPSIQ
jgi:hypothetical protein